MYQNKQRCVLPQGTETKPKRCYLFLTALIFGIFAASFENIHTEKNMFFFVIGPEMEVSVVVPKGLVLNNLFKP